MDCSSLSIHARIAARAECKAEKSRYRQIMINVIENRELGQCQYWAFTTWRLAAKQSKVDALGQQLFEEEKDKQEIKDTLAEFTEKCTEYQQKIAEQTSKISEQGQTIVAQEKMLNTIYDRTSETTTRIENTVDEFLLRLRSAEAATVMLQNRLQTRDQQLAMRDNHIKNLETTAGQWSMMLEKKDALLDQTTDRCYVNYKALGVKILALVGVVSSLGCAARLLMDDASQQPSQSVGISVARDLRDLSAIGGPSNVDRELDRELDPDGDHYGAIAGDSGSSMSYSASQVPMSTTTSSFDADHVRYAQVQLQDERIEYLEKKMQALQELADTTKAEISGSIAAMKVEMSESSACSECHVEHLTAMHRAELKEQLETQRLELSGMIQQANEYTEEELASIRELTANTRELTAKGMLEIQQQSELAQQSRDVELAALRLNKVRAAGAAAAGDAEEAANGAVSFTKPFDVFA